MNATTILAEDDLRSALNQWMRVCMTRLAMHNFTHGPEQAADYNYMYYSDFLYDAVHMANMADDEVSYFVLTRTGTHLVNKDNLPEVLRPNTGRTVAVFRVVCTSPEQTYLPRTWRITDADIEAI